MGDSEKLGDGERADMRSVIGSEVRLGSHCLYTNRDVLCGFLLCVNISGAPRLGDLGGDISSVTFYHQGKELDCRCGWDHGWGRGGCSCVGGGEQGQRLAVPSPQGRSCAAG